MVSVKQQKLISLKIVHRLLCQMFQDPAIFVVMINGQDGGNWGNTLLTRSTTPNLIWDFLQETGIEYIDPSYMAEGDQENLPQGSRWTEGTTDRNNVVAWFRDRMWDLHPDPADNNPVIWPSATYLPSSPLAHILGLRVYWIEAL
jgi:hypothetical protein